MTPQTNSGRRKKCKYDLFFLIIYSKQMAEVQIPIYIPRLNRLKFCLILLLLDSGWRLLLTILYSSFFFFPHYAWHSAWHSQGRHKTTHYLNLRRFHLQTNYLFQGISRELANYVSTQMLLAELNCLQLNSSMKTNTALYVVAINLPEVPASHQHSPQYLTHVALLGTPSHLPCCLTPVHSVKMPIRYHLLRVRYLFFEHL